MIGQEQKIEDEDMRNEYKSCWRKGEQSRIAQPGEREGGRAGKDEQTCERKCGGEGVGRLAADLVCNENEKGEIQPESAVCAVGNAGAPRIQHPRCFVKARLLLYFIQE